MRRENEFVRIMRLPAVLAVVPITRATLLRYVAAGQFPRPIRLGGTKAKARAIGWISTEVDAWIAARQAERDAAKTHEPDAQIAGAVAKRRPRGAKSLAVPA